MASILTQSGVDFEYIVIDGASTDGSVEVIMKYADKLAYWVSEPDAGVYSAMNKGLERANGEYILFLNSGDRLMTANTLANVQCFLNGIDLVYGNMRYEKQDSFYDANHYPDKLSLYYLYEHYLPHPATFIRRELFALVGNYDVRYPICADWVFFVKALSLYRASYQHIHETIAIYENDGISAQPENQDKIKRERLQALQELLPLYVDDFLVDFDLRRTFRELKRKKIFRLLGRFGLLNI